MKTQLERSEKAIQYLDHMVLNTITVIQGHFKAIEQKIEILNKAFETCESIVEEDQKEQKK